MRNQTFIYILLLVILESKFGKIYISIGKIQNEKKEDIALNANNFILRGCSLRNSKWTIGCVAYSGLFSNNLRIS